MLRTSYLPFPDMFVDYVETSSKNNMQVLQYHNAYELFFMVKGTRYLFLDGACRILNAGDLYLICPYQTHYTQSLSSDYYARYVLNFTPEYLQDFLSSGEKQYFYHNLFSDVVHLNEEQLTQVSAIFSQLVKSYPQHGYVQEKLKKSYCLQLVLLYRDFLARQDASPVSAASPSPRQEIMDAISYMNRHYQDKLRLDVLASHVHLSKYYLCRLFQEVTGATIVEYLTNLRLSQAQKLLVGTSLPIQEIAARTGFASAVHFSRTYHNSYGMSPSQTRAQHKANRAILSKI